MRVCEFVCPRKFFLFSHENAPWNTNLEPTWDKHKQTPGKETYQYDGCKQQRPYCVFVFLLHSFSLSGLNQWSVRTSFKLLHSINTGSIDFFKQLMEAFRAGKLIKIICRSSSFKDSPLVYVELNHAWLENPSIGHRNWLVFLMAFQCSCISLRGAEFLWQISCWSFNNPHTESLKTIDVCPMSSKYLVSASRQCCVSEANGQKTISTHSSQTWHHSGL